ncbi:hypothetical protein [Paenibacillus mendelii]|uniref:Glycoside hydrolase family 42 N-terminal domain-containing protein n=1 Tax=Paenibacillus mendelii TaxID=206163 RepID=A0ABV6J1U1_9BACL|nr:hypothetical protein [Paenibacillus mendelii]MCQ6562780.1 hypothetical protein [Paenibacillus mendelii]
MGKRKNNNPTPTVSGEFPIGIFVEPSPSATSDATYAEIRAMNANFIVAQQLTTPATTDWALEKAEANQLKILVTDTGMRWIQSEWISQNDDDGEGVYLRKDHSIGQTFTTPGVDDLSLAILSFKKNGAWPEGIAATLSVYDSPSKEKHIISSTLIGPIESHYPEFRLNDMPVKPDTPHYPVAANTTYYMELTTDSQAELGPFSTSAADRYAGGQAYVNGSPASYDLYFQITLKTPHGGSISAFSPTGRPSDAYIETLVDHYKDHAAVLGYNLIDEPFGELYPMLKETSDRIKALDPGRMIYTNHYALNEEGTHYYSLEGTPPMGYEDYYKNWIATNPDMISYDYYPFKKEGFDEKVHYQTLAFFREQSLLNGLDFWAYIQSVAYDYFHILEPNEPQMRFQIYSTLAYGAKGYVYWTYCTPTGADPELAQIHDAIILTDGSKNETYEYAKTINGEILNIGSVLLSLTSLAVYHTGVVPPFTEPLPEDFFWQLAGGESAVPLIISYFENETGRKFIMVVNRDLEQAQSLTFSLSAELQAVQEVCKSTGNEIATTFHAAEGTLSVSLAPGDGRLYALGES